MKRKLNFGIIAILALAVMISQPISGEAQSNKQRQQAKNLAAQGDNFYRQKMYEEAIAKYSEALQIMPKYPFALFSKGYSHFNLKQYSEAVNSLTAALDNGYTPLDVYAVRWQAYFMMKDLDSAKADIKNAEKLDPKNDYFYIAEGQLLHELTDYAGAIEAFQKAVDLNSKNNDLFFFIAKTYNAAGNYEQQKIAAEYALKNGTRFPGDAYFYIGDYNFRQRKYKEAAEAYEMSLLSNPDIYNTYGNLAESYRNLNDYQKAIKIALQGTRKYPNDGTLKVSLSWYYSLADQNGNAVAVAQEAIKLVPNQYMAHTNLCRAYNDLKQYTSAVIACNRAIALEPGDGETNFYLGRAHQLMGKSKEASEYYKKAVVGLESFTKINPDYSDGFYLLGNAYFADGQRDNAIMAYERCLQISPRFAKARYNLGYVYSQVGNATAARKQYEELQSLDADLAAKLLEVLGNK
ncbi:MAG: tetratricopeptide repeat protein [Pyrinomonadaceae bacterium]